MAKSICKDLSRFRIFSLLKDRTVILNIVPLTICLLPMLIAIAETLLLENNKAHSVSHQRLWHFSWVMHAQEIMVEEERVISNYPWKSKEETPSTEFKNIKFNAVDRKPWCFCVNC